MLLTTTQVFKESHNKGSGERKATKKESAVWTLNPKPALCSLEFDLWFFVIWVSRNPSHLVVGFVSSALHVGLTQDPEGKAR